METGAAKWGDKELTESDHLENTSAETNAISSPNIDNVLYSN